MKDDDGHSNSDWIFSDDPAARQEFERLVRAVVLHAGFVLGNFDQAHDLVSDVLIKATKTYNPKRRTSLLSWVIFLAKQAAQDHHRKKGNKIVHQSIDSMFEQFGWDHPDEKAAGEDQILSRLQFQDALRIILQLPEKQRDVLILRYYHDLSREDVQAILGISSGKIRRLEEQARQYVRSRLEGRAT